MVNQSTQSAAALDHPLRFRHALATRFRALTRHLPAAPAGLSGVLEAFRGGFHGALTGDTAAQTRETLRDIRSRLFDATGREAEANAAWNEAVATAGYAARLAQVRHGEVHVAAFGGLLHRAGEALASRLLAQAESENQVRLDGPSRAQLCNTHGRELSDRLVREWGFPAAVAGCVLGWRRFGEFEEVSREAASVYFGRLLAAELLYPEFAAPGALDALASELCLAPEALEWVRGEGRHIREVIRAV